MKTLKLFSFFFGFIALCLLASVSSSSETLKFDESVVTTLTNKTFDDFIKQNDYVLVDFYIPTCGYCRELHPHYEGAATEMKGKGVVFAAVEGTQSSSIIEKFQIRGYPTVKMFHAGKSQDYSGAHTKEGLLQWVKDFMVAAVTVIKSIDEVGSMYEDRSVVFVATVKSDATEAYKLYKEVAESIHPQSKFLVIIDDSANETMCAMRKDEGKTHSIPITSKEEIETFIRTEKNPLFGRIDGSNYKDYIDANRTLAWFVGTKEEYEDARKVILQAAAKFRDRLYFVWLNSVEFKAHAEGALGSTQFPSLVYQSTDGRYVYPTTEFTDAAKIIKFMDDALSGSIEKSLLSEPIPEPSKEPVKVVVGKTFESVVLQKDKDVFLEVYAPWCGHCIKLEPIYKEFAEAMKPYSNVIVAKMDGTKNESPLPDFSWKGFPTIFFVKAGETKPTHFNEDRSLKGLIDFYKKHGSVSIDVKTEEIKDEL